MAAVIKKLVFLTLFLPLQLQAQGYNEQSLKTLFTSQQQRQDADSDRREVGSSEGQTVVGPSSIKVNGLLKRSNGESVVWVNGKSTLNSSNIDGVIVNTNSIDSKNKISVMVEGERVRLKPGETWSEESGVSGVGD